MFFSDDWVGGYIYKDPVSHLNQSAVATGDVYKGQRPIYMYIPMKPYYHYFRVRNYFFPISA